MEQSNWHGVPAAEILESWERQQWRAAVRDTLVEVASSPDATPKDRMRALSILNEAIIHHALEFAPFPELMLAVLLDVTDGASRRTGFFARRRAKKLAGRLVGAHWTLRTAYQILGDINQLQPKTPDENAYS